MKKRVLSLLLVLVTVLALCAAAAGQSEAQLGYVTDRAQLLSESQLAQLEKMAEAVSRQFQVGVYIVTVEDFRSIHSGGVYKATYTLYHSHSLGLGPNRDGIMLLLSMDDRDWAMFCYGKRCEYAFNSYGQKQLEKVFLDNFRENDWYGGFSDYIRNCGAYLAAAEAGNPLRASPLVAILVAVGLCLLAAAVIVTIIWEKMNTVHPKSTANAYITQALQLTEKTDAFTHKTTSRRKIERSSSGGSSRSESGGGGSGRSGKF